MIRVGREGFYHLQHLTFLFLGVGFNQPMAEIVGQVVEIGVG